MSPFSLPQSHRDHLGHKLAAKKEPNDATSTTSTAFKSAVQRLTITCAMPRTPEIASLKVHLCVGSMLFLLLKTQAAIAFLTVQCTKCFHVLQESRVRVINALWDGGR